MGFVGVKYNKDGKRTQKNYEFIVLFRFKKNKRRKSGMKCTKSEYATNKGGVIGNVKIDNPKATVTKGTDLRAGK